MSPDVPAHQDVPDHPSVPSVPPDPLIVVGVGLRGTVWLVHDPLVRMILLFTSICPEKHGGRPIVPGMLGILAIALDCERYVDTS